MFYADVVRGALRDAARTTPDAMMQSPRYREFQSDFARKYAGLGHAEGRAVAVLRMLDRRGVTVTDEGRARILACVEERGCGRRNRRGNLLERRHGSRGRSSGGGGSIPGKARPRRGVRGGGGVFGGGAPRA